MLCMCHDLIGVLSRCMTGGSAPPPELINWYRETLQCDTIQIWGMTEMNPIGTYARRLSRRSDFGKTEEELTYAKYNLSGNTTSEC